MPRTLPGSATPCTNPLRLDAILVDRIMTRVGDRLFLLGSEEPLDDNTQFTVSAVDALLSVLRLQFHYVVVDVPQISGAAFRRALEMADRRVIVVNPCSSCFNLQFIGF